MTPKRCTHLGAEVNVTLADSPVVCAKSDYAPPQR